jgi:hypothetical protein
VQIAELLNLTIEGSSLLFQRRRNTPLSPPSTSAKKYCAESGSKKIKNHPLPILYPTQIFLNLIQNSKKPKTKVKEKLSDQRKKRRKRK